jgi:hypothetical protein
VTTIIGLCGPAGSGKSTVAERLESKYGAKRYAFADPLKQICMRTLDMTREQVYGTQEQKETRDPRYNFSPRWFLQRLGTEGMREVFGPDVWWKLTLDRIDNDRPALAVIEDVRFVNEAEGIRRERWRTEPIPYGFPDDCRSIRIPSYVWRLEPPGFTPTAAPTHQSEAQWSLCKYDYKLAPLYRGLEHLYDCIDALAQTCGLEARSVLKSWG